MTDELKNAWHHVRGITSEEMKQAAVDAQRQYGDIIHLSRPVSTAHPPLTMEQKAAQYSPFAALTGYGDAIDETARLTQQRVELDEDQKARLDRKLQWIAAQIQRRPRVCLTCFVSDLRKDGGKYVTVCGAVRKIDRVRGSIVLSDGREIPIADLFDITDFQEEPF